MSWRHLGKSFFLFSGVSFVPGGGRCPSERLFSTLRAGFFFFFTPGALSTRISSFSWPRYCSLLSCFAFRFARRCSFFFLFGIFLCPQPRVPRFLSDDRFPPFSEGLLLSSSLPAQTLFLLFSWPDPIPQHEAFDPEMKRETIPAPALQILFSPPRSLFSLSGRRRILSFFWRPPPPAQFVARPRAFPLQTTTLFSPSLVAFPTGRASFQVAFFTPGHVPCARFAP